MRGKEERKAEGLRTRKERGEEEARERVAVTGARMKREREEETEKKRGGRVFRTRTCPLS